MAQNASKYVIGADGQDRFAKFLSNTDWVRPLGYEVVLKLLENFLSQRDND